MFINYAQELKVEYISLEESKKNFVQSNMQGQ